MRTFQQTSKSVIQHVVNANRQRYDFDFVVATYENQDARTPRYRDRSNHSTTYESTVNAEMLWKTYHKHIRHISRSPFKAAWIHVFNEDEIGAVLPRAILRQAPHLNKIKRLQDKNEIYMINRIKRSLALVQQGIFLVHDLGLKRGRPHDLIFRLRPDLQLLSPLPLDQVRQAMWYGIQSLETNPSLYMRSRLVLPVTYDPRGGLNIRPTQLSTRPCARNGTLRPLWVQDHMALASMATMVIYARFYHSYLKPHIFSSHVETSLAKYLSPEQINVSCLDSIRYTVVR
uniref:Uncharacterized protein n=1 Tax=Aureoumbra lagunensis TaxID=44058 RepID=A0A7S3JWG6_9STRA|mmetsp:Transcript_19239/g.29178  ORF Transcript_19239/g.29178 Transcript_19239/m.29178 type:complete len:287 (+) Transcript_19239:603-1463(+)